MHPSGRHLPRVERCASVLALLLGGVACLAQAPAPAAAGKAIISDVIIQGNRQVTTETIRAQLKTRPGAEYNPEVVQDDVRTLYSTRQFGNVRAQEEQDGPGRVKIYFYVRDLRSTVEEVVYQGAKHIKDDELSQLTGVRKGAPLNPYANKVACKRIVQKLNEEGRPFATCDLLAGGEGTDARVIFNITEGPKVKITGVEISGNDFVSTAFLKARLTSADFQPRLEAFPTVYNPEAVEKGVCEIEDWYRSLGFREVHVSRELRWAPDGHDVLLRLHIEEGPRSRPTQPVGNEPAGTAPLFQH